MTGPVQALGAGLSEKGDRLRVPTSPLHDDVIFDQTAATGFVPPGPDRAEMDSCCPAYQGRQVGFELSTGLTGVEGAGQEGHRRIVGRTRGVVDRYRRAHAAASE